MRLLDINPAALGQQAHDHVVSRIHALMTALDPMHVEAGIGDGPSEVRRVVTVLAHYAKTGEPPEGRPELVHEYLVSLIPAGLLPEDLDRIGDEPETEDPTAAAVHAVVLAVLARERLAQRQPVPTAWLAALGSTQASYVRRLVASGELQASKQDQGDRRTYVTPASAQRWVDSRRAS